MKIFMDTADVAELAAYVDWGVVWGVTTNPSLIAKTGRPQEEVIPKIASLVSGPVSAEVIATDAAGMVEEAKKLSAIAPNVVIKIPCTAEGLRATKVLAYLGIPTNVTLIFSLSQAMLAARAGATYVSPFIGRLDDIGEDGVKLVADIVAAFKLYQIETQVIAASIRSVKHVEEVMLTGCHIATIPTKVLAQMIKHELTDKGLAAFIADYEKSKKA